MGLNVFCFVENNNKICLISAESSQGQKEGGQDCE